MEQQEVSGIDRSSLARAMDDHLTRALEAEDPDTKNYHIRSLKQLCVVMEAREHRRS